MYGELLYKSDLVELKKYKNICILYLKNGKQNKVKVPEFIELEALNEIMNDYNFIAMIITGTGRYFTSGADIEEFNKYKGRLEDFMEVLNKGKDLLKYIEKLPLITVAAINGACFGAGFEIALSCQFRIASKKAFISLPESNIGLMPGMGGNIRLTNLIGKSKAIKFIIKGEMISADEGLKLGIVDHVVSSGKELPYAIDFVETLTKDKSMDQIRSIIDTINSSLYDPQDLAYKMESGYFTKLVGKSY